MRLCVLRVCMALLLAWMCAGGLLAQRRCVSVNDGWKFRFLHQVDRNSGVSVTLPRTWNAADALSGKIDYKRGIGNYERKLDIAGEWAVKRIYLRFEGANSVANVFVNGKHVGEHRGGYSAFVFDVTGYVDFGKENVQLVRVSNVETLDVMPLVGDFNMYGGNVIRCDNAVIMVDKVIQANPHYSASKLFAELTRLFGCEVFLIPWDDEEGVYGHSDGVVRYLSDGDLLFTKYPDPKYIKQCQYMLKSHFNKMHNLWMPSGGAKCRERFQWAYINSIRTKDYIFIPALSKNADCIEDTTTRRQFELRFPEYPKENIIPIYALEVLKREGGLH